jgi:hypothetical protein
LSAARTCSSLALVGRPAVVVPRRGAALRHFQRHGPEVAALRQRAHPALVHARMGVGIVLLADQDGVDAGGLRHR